jgi:hypothetical protein
MEEQGRRGDYGEWRNIFKYKSFDHISCVTPFNSEKDVKWRNKGEEKNCCMIKGREETDSRRNLFRSETSCDRPFNSGIS